MGVRGSHFVLFLASVLMVRSAAAAAAEVAAGPEGEKKLIATLQLINAIPKNESQSIRVNCNNGNTNPGLKNINSGEVYEWRVEEKTTYVCLALWDRWFKSFEAFQPRKDGCHDQVFWLLKTDGLFHSWDNSTWVKEHIWETD
ncbi:Plant self-incompatibility S1 [Corchorus olitorius]|uniref:Plant self-incompatibility S1 n=1 Tax=Corchorus olitorius TaxID=93759 RepID=A0A1R3HY92_9ROSI|nr:Plant self-incompatibility S1 [Corchorus olitorius]